MDRPIKKQQGSVTAPDHKRPTRQEAEDAVTTLLQWIGEDVKREGLLDTPARFVRTYNELFGGYNQDPFEVLGRALEDTDEYGDMVLVRDIVFYSHCEHHVSPIVGKVHVAYLPDKKAAGLSKIARVVEIFARRLQTQERMTVQIARTIDQALKPKGVAIMVQAQHMCMTMRGISKQDINTTTTHYTGVFHDSFNMQNRFLTLPGINNN